MKKYRTKSGKVEEKLPGVNATVNPSEKAQIAMAGGANTLKDVQTILGQEGKRNNLKGQGAKHLVSFQWAGEEDSLASFGLSEADFAGFSPNAPTGHDYTSEGYASFAEDFGPDPRDDPPGGPDGGPMGEGRSTAQDAVKSAFLDASKQAKEQAAHDRAMNIASKAVGLNLERARAAAMPDPTLEELFPGEYGPKYEEAFALEPTPFSRDKARDQAREALVGGPPTIGEKGTDWNKIGLGVGLAKAGAGVAAGVTTVATGGLSVIASLLGYGIMEDIKARKTTTSSTPVADGKMGKRVDTTYATRALAAAKAAKDRPTTPDYSGDGDDAPKKKKKLIALRPFQRWRRRR